VRPPTFVYDRSIATVTWDWLQPAIEMRFDLLRLDRRTGEVSAEVTTTAGLNGSTELLHRSRLNLVSTRSRAEAATHLERRLEGQDWPRKLEAACWKVVEAHRRGRPAMLLREAKEPESASWALKPLLLARDPVLIFGDGGTSKSYLALALALAVHTGEPIAGLTPTAPLRVAYLDFEWQEWPHNRRMRALLGRRALPDLLYVPCQSEGPLSHQVDRLRGIFHEHQIEYAVVDSVGLACDGPPEEAQSALAFFQAFARLEVGGELIAHVNRDGDTSKPFGSAFWHNSARATWYVKKVQEIGANTLDVGLYNRKANDGPLQPAVGLRFEFSELRTHITATDLHDVPELANQVPLKDRMSHALAGGAMTYAELAEHLDESVDSVSRIARRYEGRLFTLADAGGKKQVSLQTMSPDTVRPDTRTLSDLAPEGGRTDSGGLYSPLSGPPSGRTKREADTSRAIGKRCPAGHRCAEPPDGSPECCGRPIAAEVVPVEVE
jgi:hypothetical protein